MQVSLNEALPLGHQRGADLVALDDALQTLAEFDARKCKVVELRFFGGLSVKEKRKSCGFHYPWERRRLACHERGNRRSFPSRGDRFTCNGHLREVVCIAALANSRRDACAPGRWRERIWMIAADGMMMAVPMSGGAFESPKALFKTRMLTGLIQSGIDYDVTADGQRFLIGTKVGDPMPVTVFLNWTAGLKK
ncbi:MAG: hypothetical protein JST84_10190 [Acidobacteria bacterium]|nr:hypothetical protein [Acidobacteriota bacterium]